MKRVYLVRHGQTTYNVEHRVQDGSSLLTELGYKQAQQVADRLTAISFDHLVVSDYERTKQTAEPTVLATGKIPQLTHLFREVRRPSEFFHTLRETDEYQKFQSDEYENFGQNPEWHHSDEENFVDVNKRAKESLEYLLTLEGDIAVISHGHFIRYIVALVATQLELDGPTWQKMCSSFIALNTGITTLEYDDKSRHWRILTFNDIAHFAE
jgi:broad specificity phosphatase PhoE